MIRLSSFVCALAMVPVWLHAALACSEGAAVRPMLAIDSESNATRQLATAPVPPFKDPTVEFQALLIPRSPKIDEEIRPLEMCFRLTHLDSANTEFRKYDVVIGSQIEGDDDEKTKRFLGSCKLVDTKDFVTSISDGKTMRLNTGYLIASGQAPIAVARRVRAVSDGTQFVIELLGNNRTRVYLISVADEHTLTVQAQGDNAVKELKLNKDDIDWFVEIDANGELLPKRKVADSGDAAVQHFYKEMKKIITSPTFPKQPGQHLMDADEPVSLGARFRSLFPEGTVIHFNP